LETASPAVPVTPPKALEPSRVLAFMILDELGAHLFDSTLSFYRWEYSSGIAINNFFCSLFNSIHICNLTLASLPFRTTYIAKLCFANASENRSAYRLKK
jgi:hypothetical protein